MPGALSQDDDKSQQAKPSFVMCPPKYLSTKIPNNVWMKSQKIDKARAMAQYRRAKNVIEALGTHVMEIPPEKGCQDQMYVANIAISLDPWIVLANYKADGRDCEVAPAKRFFEGLGYKTCQPKDYFEGEADLKKLRGNTYIGGYGLFSDEKAMDWIADKTGIEIIKIRETNEKTYHLDCCILVLDEENIMVAKGGLDRKGIRELERHANLIVTPEHLLTTGCTNAVLIPDRRIFLSGTFNPEMPKYREAMEWLNETMDAFGYTCVFLDVDESDKSGADLSCCVMHLDFQPNDLSAK